MAPRSPASGRPVTDRRRQPSRSVPVAYSIRLLQPDDLEGISRVHWRACRIAYRFMGWSYSLDEVRRWYADKMTEWDWGQVACAGEVVVAFIAATGPHIDQLFVDPDHQRAGLGSALLGAMLERRLRPITLCVFAENRPARSFYEKFGFCQAGAWWDQQENAAALSYRLD
jgi:ribosomal protein S18 acetylase RimI-like enzyme